MNNITYIMFILKKNKGLAIFSSTIISLLIFLIIWLLTLFDVPSLYSSMLTFFPKKFQIFINDQFVTSFTLNGSIAFAFNHPMVLAILAINAILIPTKHISGELAEGTMELLLSFPIKRKNLLLSLWISIVFQLFIIISITFIFALTAILVYHTFTWLLFFNMIKIGSNLWFFFICIGTLTLLFNVYSSIDGNAGIRSAGMLLVFYLINYITSLWQEIAFIKPFNIFTYYQPNKIMFGQASILEHLIVLGGLIIIVLIISLRKFVKRDIT